MKIERPKVTNRTPFISSLSEKFMLSDRALFGLSLSTNRSPRYKRHPEDAPKFKIRALLPPPPSAYNEEEVIRGSRNDNKIVSP